MKKITFSADDSLIEAARERARSENSTLNEEFRRWLAEYSRLDEQAELALQTISDLRTRIKSGVRRFTREEMNER